MSAAPRKRKDGPAAAADGRPAYKKSKGGNGGKWKTPHQKVKMAEKVEMGKTMGVGDQGIWVTFARGMAAKAVREFRDLCHEHAKEMYGVESPGNEEDKPQIDGEDIEASMEAELSAMKAPETSGRKQLFTPVSTGVECLFFMRTMQPVEPGELVRRMSLDARDCSDPRHRKCRYVNRLTPVFDTDKATDHGIVKVARTVLPSWFTLKHNDSVEEAENHHRSTSAETMPAYTYAIRHNIRNHNAFKSEEVIKKIAGLIDERHKVNLGQPDKVILIEIFQLFCGISVVDGREWEKLKRYNLNALYDLALPEGTKA